MFPDNGEGEMSAELEDTVQNICDDVAHVPDNDLGDLRDGEESDDLDDVLKDSFHQIQTNNMFRSVMLHPWTIWCCDSRRGTSRWKG